MIQDLRMKSTQFQGLDCTELVPKQDQEQEFRIRRSQWSSVTSISKRRTFYKRSLYNTNMNYKEAPGKLGLKGIARKINPASRPACRKANIYPRRCKPIAHQAYQQFDSNTHVDFQPFTSSSSNMVNDNKWSQVLDVYTPEKVTC